MRSPGRAELSAECSSALVETGTRRECGYWLHAVSPTGGGAGAGGGGAGAGGVGVGPDVEPVTLIVAESLFPLAVPMIVALPTATPVTRPLLDTEATDLLVLLHATVPPDTEFPSASLNEAASCSVLPCATEPDAGVIVMLLTAPADTVKFACPECPFDVAVTVAVPTCDAEASPLDDTVTTLVLELDHVTDCPETVLPLPSVSRAESCVCAPAAMLFDPGLTLTLLTAPAATVSDDEPLAPPAAAVIVALPACFAVTTPLDDTLATALLELDHATFSLSEFPAASESLAESCCVPPLARRMDEGDTAIDFTAPAETTTAA